MEQEIKIVNPKKEAFKFYLTYLALGIVWIILSDTLLARFIDDWDKVKNFSIIKDIIFVTFTAVIFTIIYVQKIILSNKSLTDITNAYDNINLIEEELAQQYENTKKTNM